MSKKTTYTWEELETRRTLLRKEAGRQEKRIRQQAQQLFAAPQPESTLDRMLNYAQSGMSVYDGFMTGFKLFKKLTYLFNKSKKKA